MTSYILTRLLLLVLTVVGVSFVAFGTVRLIPAGYVDQVVAQSGFSNAKTKAQFEHRLGLDRPVLEQYAKWLGGVLHGDFGRSLRTGRPISGDLKQRLPVTFELGVLSLFFGMLVGIPVGIVSAIKQDSPWDYSLRGFSVGMLAVPNYWVATIILIGATIWFSWTPPTNYRALTDSPLENLRHMLLPAAILGVTGSATLMRFTRTAMLETLRLDYIRTARAKGLTERAVIVRHALRNSLIPVITVVGITLGLIFGGTVIFEQIFALPGMGRYILDAVNTRDYPQIQAAALLFGLWVVFINLATDIVYAYIDPRIRY